MSAKEPNSKAPAVLHERHFVTTIAVLVVTGAVAIIWQLYAISENLVQTTAVRNAAAYNQAVAEFRTLYTSEVVVPLARHGITPTHDYQQHSGKIPLPATLTKMLGDRLGDSDSSCSTRLYSDYPFPWTKEGGPRDDFERKALIALQDDPETPYYEFRNVRGEPVIRYATADRMRSSCVACHNAHPQSPKADWREGDVRGVLSTSMPLRGTTKSTQRAVGSTVSLIGAFGSGILFLFALTLTRLRRKAEQEDFVKRELLRKASEAAEARIELERTNLQLQRTADSDARSRAAALNLMRDMRGAKEAAEAATTVKSQFLANMSHEIRTPMTAILGFAETLAENVTGAENFDAVMTIRRNGDHLLKVINDVLDLSKIEAGKFQMENVACSPAEVIRQVGELMQVRADAKGLCWQVSLAGPLPREVRTDPTRLRQILINLVGNAIKFTEVGAVELTARAVHSGDSTKIVFDVTDEGIGLTDDQCDQLFQPFTQADVSMSREYGGTGLGLAISQRFAELLGGNLRVDSRLGKGSTFTLTIDVGKVDDIRTIDRLDAVSSEDEPEPTAKAEVTLGGMRVLLVEDGPDNQRLLSFILRKADAEVTLAENGRIGCDLVNQAVLDGNRFDVVLMDMQMPVMDGYEATRVLREQSYSGPIIALTAHAMVENRKRCLDAGCDDVITKPVDRFKLVRLLAASCQNRSEVGVPGEPTRFVSR